MDKCEEDTVQLHGEDEIIEVIDLDDTEHPATGQCTLTTCLCNQSHGETAHTSGV